MSNLVPTEDIERIVGVPRHYQTHYARVVSAEQTVYILHSRDCLDSGVDLRQCRFSLALDRGIDERRWAGHEDVAVVLDIWNDELVPVVAAVHMSDIEDLVEASSLGTPAAKAARDSVSEEDAQRIVDRADPCHPNPQCRALAESKGEDL